MGDGVETGTRTSTFCPKLCILKLDRKMRATNLSPTQIGPPFALPLCFLGWADFETRCVGCNWIGGGWWWVVVTLVWPAGEKSSKDRAAVFVVHGCEANKYPCLQIPRHSVPRMGTNKSHLPRSLMPTLLLLPPHSQPKVGSQSFSRGSIVLI